MGGISSSSGSGLAIQKLAKKWSERTFFGSREGPKRGPVYSMESRIRPKSTLRLWRGMGGFSKSGFSGPPKKCRFLSFFEHFLGFFGWINTYSMESRIKTSWTSPKNAKKHVFSWFFKKSKKWSKNPRKSGKILVVEGNDDFIKNWKNPQNRRINWTTENFILVHFWGSWICPSLLTGIDQKKVKISEIWPILKFIEIYRNFWKYDGEPYIYKS